jgi:hypothetical protein
MTEFLLHACLHLFEPWANFLTLVADEVPSSRGWMSSEWGGHTVEGNVIDSHGFTTEPRILGESFIKDWDHSLKGNTLFSKFWACSVNSFSLLVHKATTYAHAVTSDRAGKTAASNLVKMLFKFRGIGLKMDTEIVLHVVSHSSLPSNLVSSHTRVVCIDDWGKKLDNVETVVDLNITDHENWNIPVWIILLLVGLYHCVLDTIVFKNDLDLTGWT